MSFCIQNLFIQQQHQEIIYGNISDKARFRSIRWIPLFSWQKESLLVALSFNPFEMAAKKNQYSIDFRSLVIQHYLNGNSYAMRATKVLIPRPTIQSIIKKYNKTKNLESFRSKSKTKSYRFC